MRFAFISLLVVFGCGPVVTGGGSSEGGGGGSPASGGNCGTDQSGTGGSGGSVSATGPTSGAGGNVTVGGGGTSVTVGGGGTRCLTTAGFSEDHNLTQMKPDSSWTPDGDPTTVDCPPLSELAQMSALKS